MKTNIKALQLIEKGLSSNTVSKLTESQINTLHSKLFVNLLREQAGTTMVSGTDKAKIEDLKSKKQTFQVYEKEIDEDDTLDITKDPDATDDGMGIFEVNDENKPNPYSICHSQVGPKKSRKWERCVREIKKQLKEGKNPVSLFLENQITKIVEKHMPPKITKGDLIKHITESDSNFATKHLQPGFGTEVAPSKPKPKVEPGTKETPKPKPFDPRKNPHPGEKEAPRAISPERAKDTVIDVIMKMLEK